MGQSLVNEPESKPELRKIKLQVYEKGVQLLSNELPEDIRVGSVILVSSYNVRIVSGFSFKMELFDNQIQWYAGLGMRGRHFALKICVAGNDVEFTFDKVGIYLIGYPNYFRLLKEVTQQKKRSNRSFLNDHRRSKKKKKN